LLNGYLYREERDLLLAARFDLDGSKAFFYTFAGINGYIIQLSWGDLIWRLEKFSILAWYYLAKTISD